MEPAGGLLGWFGGDGWFRGLLIAMLDKRSRGKVYLEHQAGPKLSWAGSLLAEGEGCGGRGRYERTLPLLLAQLSAASPLCVAAPPQGRCRWLDGAAPAWSARFHARGERGELTAASQPFMSSVCAFFCSSAGRSSS